MRVIANLIYKAKRGHVYDKTKIGKRYNCYMPTMSGDFAIVDAFPCDENGNVHPGYNVSGVPIYTGNLGQVVGKLECEE